VSAFVVGLTGPIGAGKTTVAAMLRELGARVLDADAIARDEQSRGTTGYSAIVQQFGTEVLGADKEIDRRKLGDIVFADPRRLEQLEKILHPRVIARILEARKMLPDDQVLVVEAIKLVETSLRNACDRIWVVLASRDRLIWYALPQLWPGFAGSWFTPFMAAWIALSLNEAAYMSEIIRAGLLSVDPGQELAGRALGMTRRQILRRAKQHLQLATG